MQFKVVTVPYLRADEMESLLNDAEIPSSYELMAPPIHVQNAIHFVFYSNERLQNEDNINTILGLAELVKDEINVGEMVH